MKFPCFIIALMLLFSSCYAQEKGKLIWSDEFSGECLSSDWSLGWPKRWETTNTLENAEVSNGTLKIHVTTKDGVHYSTMLTTEGKVERTYGYWETKVKFNDQSGTWSDFWLYSHEMHWSRKGAEVDVFEHRLKNWDGSDIPELISYGVHYNGYGPQSWTVGGSFKIDTTKDWHVFGLRATKNKYIWYLDNKEVTEVYNINTVPLFAVLSTELQNWNWASKTLEKYDHVIMEVDYVRVYE